MLFECDWNMINNIVSKRTMQLAEITGTIAPEQYGSRQKKSAIQHATNKQLLFDIIRQRKDNVVLIILDAKACYDRIVIPFASLCLQRQGVPQHTICVMFKTLAQMKHFIRTYFGDSTVFYVQQDNTPFHGIGQGNGAGPMIWVTVSTPLLNHLRNNNCGYFLKTYSSTTHQFTAFTFVDDNDIVQGIDTDTPVHLQAQRTLDLWEDALRTSGGACAPEKSAWTALIHRWNGTRWSTPSTRQSPGDLLMKNDLGTSIPLKRLKPTEATRALGILFSPTGQMHSHYKYLLGKCTEWANRISRCSLTRTETHTALITTIWKTMEYSLQSTTFTEKQCTKLANTVLYAALPRMGFCRNIDRRPIFSSKKFQGFGLKHPYFSQGLKKLQLLLNPTDPTSSLLITESIHMTQLECGLGPDFFSTPPDRFLPIIEHTWVSSLWKFLFDANITLHVTHTQCSGLRFPADRFLMDAFCQHYQRMELRGINYCRIYLQVSTLSDILTMCGRRIRPNCWNGKYQQNSNDPSVWPNQPNPSKQLWVSWRQALQRTFNTDSNGLLLFPITICNFQPICWTWFYDQHSQRLYEYLPNGAFIVWTKTPTSRSRKSVFQKSSLSDIPSHRCPCTISLRRSLIVLESYYSGSVDTNAPTTTSSAQIQSLISSHCVGNDNLL
jgi:hypothetical protein